MRTKYLAVSVPFLSLTLPISSSFGNLLTDPGFEANPLAPSFNTELGNFPLYQNQWGVESGAIVPMTGAISPASGKLMLQLQGPNTGTASQGGQVFDVTSYAALIDAGQAQLQAGMLLNSDAPAAIGGIYVSYFTGNSYGTLFGPNPGNVLTPLDASTATWELASLIDTMPAGTRWVLVQAAFDAASITGTNSSGLATAGYVDDTYANIVPIPEPASLSLVSLTTLALLRRRRVAKESE